MDPLESRMLFALPTVSIDATSLKPAREPGTIRQFMLHRSGSTSRTLFVNLTIGGTARNGLDYGSIGKTAIIPAGARNVLIKVRPVNDEIVEATESVTLTIDNSSKFRTSSTNANATIRIKDNDGGTNSNLPMVTVTANSNAAEAGASGSFTLSRTGSTAAALAVSLVTTGSATSGTDYNAVPSTVTIPAGASQTTVNVKTIDDTAAEGNETVTLNIAQDTNRYSVGSGAATISIIDNDKSPLATNITWTSRTAAPVGRGEAATATFGNRLYLFGGYTDFSATNSTRTDYFDASTNTWGTGAAAPVGVSHAGTVTVGRNVYLAGGYTGGPGGSQTFATSQVQVYNVDANTWTTIASLPAARGGGAMAAVGNVLHFFGGSDLSRTDRSEHWAFDLSNPGAGWVSRAALPTARTHMGAVTLNGKIYAIGGQKNQDQAESPQSAVEVYDPVADKWTTAAALPFGRSHINSATIVVSGRIFTLGGETTYQNAINNVTAYDPDNNTWTNVTPLPVSHASGVASFINNKFYYTTGDVTTGTYEGAPS
jgi:N-acetylneuraminic acid mutarotase